MKHIDWTSRQAPLRLNELDEPEEELEDHPEFDDQPDFVPFEWELLRSTGRSASQTSCYDTDEEFEPWILDAIAQEEERVFLEGFAEQEYQRDLALGLIDVKPNPKGGLTQ